MMYFEGEVKIRRSDPETLAGDMRAVADLLEHRKAARAQERGNRTITSLEDRRARALARR